MKLYSKPRDAYLLRFFLRISWNLYLIGLRKKGNSILSLTNLTFFQDDKFRLINGSAPLSRLESLPSLIHIQTNRSTHFDIIALKSLASFVALFSSSHNIAYDLVILASPSSGRLIEFHRMVLSLLWFVSFPSRESSDAMSIFVKLLAIEVSTMNCLLNLIVTLHQKVNGFGQNAHIPWYHVPLLP